MCRTRAALAVVGLGASAGALEPLKQFFAAVPSDSGLAYVVVQHVDPRRPNLLAEFIGKRAVVPVRQAEDGAYIEQNCVYIAPPNALLTLAQGRLRLTRPLSSGERTSIDAFLCSLAQEAGENAVGILFSGAGTDGTVGIRAIRERGGLTLAQAPATAKYDSMAENAIAAGLVDVVCAVDEMPDHLLDFQRRRAGGAGGIEAEIKACREEICALLLARTGHDFRCYKDGTLLRRIKRRVGLCHAGSAREYVALIEDDPHEADRLVKDLLIGVTQFFRDPEAFRVIAEQVLPRLLEARPAGACLRMWVPGCASGEEAYSLAMLARERLDQLGDLRPVQIFATDVDNDMIAQARMGRYPEEIAEHVSAERLERFFVHQKGWYHASRELRDMCVFALHNLVSDPPFSSLDLVSCRNVLIYLDADLQKRLIPLFHYALRPGGCLFLGPSEGLAANSGLFGVLDKTRRIFSRNDAARPLLEFPPVCAHMVQSTPALPAGAMASPLPIVSQAFERTLLDRHVPPCAVVNEQGDILSSAGRLTRLLPQAAGAPMHNLLDLAQGPLRIELRAALIKAAKLHRRIVKDHVPVDIDVRVARVRLTVQPLPGLSQDAGLYMVVFEETAIPEPEAEDDEASWQDEPLINHLEDELRTTRADLDAVVEALENANEELKSSNEELLSTNEELQSSNEELQTSREEIQAINDELHRKVELLATTNADLANLFAGTNVATLFLDRDLRITRFTPAATALFHLVETDVGRSIEAFAPRFQGQDVIADARAVLESRTAVERQVQAPDGKWFVARVLPYRTVTGVVAGVVITFVDVSEIKHVEHELRRSESFLRAVLEATPDPLFLKDVNCRIVLANRAMLELVGKPAGAVIGKTDLEFYDDPKVGEALLENDRRVMQSGKTEVIEERTLASEGYRTHLSTKAPWRDASGSIAGVIGVMRDITERVRANKALKRSEDQLRVLIENVSAGVALIDERGKFSLFNHQFLKMFGLAQDADIMNVNDRDWSAFQVFDERGRLLDVDDHPVRKASLTGRAVRDQLVSVRLPRSRETVWMLVSAEPLFDARGKMENVICTYTDITERKRDEEALRESRAKLDVALASMTDAVFISDAGGRFIEFNDAFATYHRFPDKAACAKTLAEYPAFLDVFLPDGTPVPLDQWAVPRALRGETAANAEYTLRRKDTGETWIGSYSFAPIRDEHGAVVGSVVTARDVTEAKHAELAVRASERSLKEADQNKNEFLAVLSHELRNPLAPICNSLNILDRAAPGGEQARRAKAVIDRQVGQLSRLVDDLLDVTRIARGKTQIWRAPFELSGLLQRAAEDYRSEIVGAGAALDVRLLDRPLWVNADAARIAQAVGNVLQNAAKFTGRGGRVTLSLEDDAAGQVAVIRVRDTGVGIAPELLARLFQPFTQADHSLDRRKGGLGLGLALVKGLVELHGGTVEAHSAGLGEGTEIVLRLPLHYEPEVSAPDLVQEPDSPSRRVLIVEDNVDAADSLREVLELDGHTVESAYDGPEGIEKARGFEPDVVLCDIGLPGMDGFEVARALRADERLRGAYLVALSGYALPEDLRRAREAGFDRHISKPPDLEQIAQAMAAAPRRLT